MNARERDQEGWWQRLQPVLNKELGWFGIPVKPKAAQIIARAGLPAEASALVQRVVKRTRLRRGEKRDVARELCGHFLDGIEAGAEVSELIRLFGDEKAAAKLIRRGKLRNRGILWKSWVAVRWGALGVVGVFLFAYVIFAVRLAMSERVISRDYLAEFNAPALAVPVEERGWTILQEAEAILEQPPILAAGDEPQAYWSDVTPGSKWWPTMVEYIKRNEPSLEGFRRAAAAPHMAYVASSSLQTEQGASGVFDGALINVLLPNLGRARDAERLLGMDASLAAIEGDGARVVSNIRAMRELARGVSESPFLISGLVGLSIDSESVVKALKILQEYPELFSGAQLRDLAHVLAAQDARDLMAGKIQTERAAFVDIVQRVYTDDGHGDGLADASAMGELYERFIEQSENPTGSRAWAAISPIAAMALPGRRETIETVDRFYSSAESRLAVDMWEWGPDETGDLFDELVSRPAGRWRHWLIYHLLPALTKSARSQEVAQQRLDAALVVVAITLFKRQYGHWPQTLEELVPSMLPSVPKDRFTGGPIGYTLRDGLPVVYSVGLDRDDDGGRAPATIDPDLRRWGAKDWISREDLETALRDAPETVPDGDWILWPPMKD